MKKNTLVVDKEWDEIIHHEAKVNEQTGEITIPAWDETVHKKLMKSVNVDLNPEEEAKVLLKAEEENRWEETAFWAMPYPARVSKLIRERYSLDDELALSRQREIKSKEFEEYFLYCEKCKANSREQHLIQDSSE